ncbi:TPA: hypothetical protein DCX15_02705 [bacterium]|nr:hypothetical protein [bacterium]
MMLSKILLASLIGGLFSLDERAVAQTMISRPIVVSPLIGFILGLVSGNPAAGLADGLFIGVILELIWIKVIPIGAHVPPNVCLSSTLGVGLSQMIQGERITVLMISLILAVLSGLVLREIEIKNRELNDLLANRILRSVEEGRLTQVGMLNLLSIGITLLTGVLILMVGLYVGVNLAQIVIDSLPMKIQRGFGVSFYLLPLVAIAAALEAFFRFKV